MVNASSASSAAGTLTLLHESDPELQTFALEELNTSVDIFWSEIADHLSRLEVLYEDTKFPSRDLAALVTSKVYYHLGDLNEALAFALGAGKLFDVGNVTDQYVETIISQCIDRYVEAQNEGTTSADARLKQVVERMFQRCIDDREYKQALGIALEARRLDVVERVFGLAHDNALLAYVLEAAITVVHKLDFRNTVLRLLVKLFSTLSSPDYFSMAQCFVYLNDAQPAAALLTELLTPSTQSASEHERLLTAYQIAFDLAETATQEFLGNVRQALGGGDTPVINGSASMETDEAGSRPLSDPPLAIVQRILSGEESIKLYLEFLFRNNRTDLLILKNTKDALESRNSVFHSAMTFANAFANAGTTSDQFLRDNLDWLAKAANWAKFSATAALGVIYKGSIAQAMTILQPYLPQEGGGESTSMYSEGGSLYALGLLNANHGAGVLPYLRRQLKAGGNETILHGAALGLGMAGMATGNEEIYDELREVLYNDSAVAGEAAGYAMGLIMLGTGSTKATEEMLAYAHETQHEKIIRGLSIGLSFLVYGRQEQADGLIDTLASDKDPILRYGGIHALAMAYAGTGNNKAIRRLLHVAVSDVNDDVRRAAVTSLGFLLFRTPTQVPRIVQLLSESYNPNVRYGAALALGISCAGSGLEDAIELLEPLTKDPVDFVRQIACISLGMVLVQQNEATSPRLMPVRKTFERIISDKHEDVMAKMGAALAQGLIDAGGRNVTISLQSRTGNANMAAIVGLSLFSQFWYWFPMAHAVSLAFTPTALIGIDVDFRLPKFEFTSNAKPSLYAYVPATKPPSTEKPEMVATAVLSTTVKAKQREKAKEQEKAGADGMETDKVDSETATTQGTDVVAADDAMQTDKPSEDKAASTKLNGDKATAVKGEGTGKPKRPRKEEPSSEQLPNLSRVTPAQLAHVTFANDARFMPIRDVKAGAGGILVVRDRQPDAAHTDYIALEANKALEEAVRAQTTAPAAAAAGAQSGATGGPPPADDDEPIAEVPEPFEYDFSSG